VAQLAPSAVVIIVTMVTLEWLESTRARLGRAGTLGGGAGRHPCDRRSSGPEPGRAPATC